MAVGVAALGFIIYRSSGFINLANFSGAKLWQVARNANPYYLLLSLVAIYGCYALRAPVESFPAESGTFAFRTDLRDDACGLRGYFPPRPRWRAGASAASGAQRKTAHCSAVWNLCPRAIVRFGERCHHCRGRPAAVSIARSTSAIPRANWKPPRQTTGSLLFAGVAVAVAFLLYLRLHGSALLERRLQGWVAAHGWRGKIAAIVLGFTRGVQAIQSWSDLALSVFYSAAHWFLVLLVYLWVSHSFGGSLSGISLGDAMLVMSFTLVGSAVQLPGVGGGSQVASFLAYTAIFGVEKESAAAASIVMWLITFAACSLAGVPLLIHEGLSLGKLKEMAEHEKEAAIEGAAQQGDSAQ